jgi:hypothetical protein
MARHGKKYQEAAKLVDRDKLYEPEEAIALAKKTSYANFDETLELHLHMNLDPRHADQQIRGVATLPHGLGKGVRVLVFTQGEALRAAEEAGADYVGGSISMSPSPPRTSWERSQSWARSLADVALCPTPNRGPSFPPRTYPAPLVTPAKVERNSGWTEQQLFTSPWASLASRT